MKQYKEVLFVFVIWFVIINLFALFANNRLDLNSDTAYTWIDSGTFFQIQDQSLLEIRNKWDSEWYLDIAENGYSYTKDQLSNIVFFPLYPILIVIFSTILFIPKILAGWIVSSLFLLFSLILLYKYVKENHPSINPLEPVIFLLVFPTAFFLNAIYTESLFIFLSIATFYLTFKKQYWFAGLLGFLASLTRINGILLFIPIFIEIIRNETNVFKNFNANIFKNIIKKTIPLTLIILAPILFFFYHYVTFGDFLAFLKVEGTFGRSFILNEDHFIFQTTAAYSHFLFDSVIAIFFVLIAIYMIFKFRLSYGLYTLVIFLLPTATGTLMSIGRYMIVAFPIFIFLASLKNKYLKATYLFLSTLMMAVITILFVSNGWAG